MPNQHLETFVRLLQSDSFAEKQMQATESYLPQQDVKTTALQEKVATNLAGFYALLGGMGLLGEEQGIPPSAVLNKILDERLAEKDWETLCRFANTAWKATQPFRGLERIGRPGFVPFSLLSNTEIKKDRDQIAAAARVLQVRLQPSPENGSLDEWTTIGQCMHHFPFLEEMARALDAVYYTGQGQAPPPFFEEKDFPKEISHATKAATLAYLYALEGAVDFCSHRQLADPIFELESSKDLTPELERLLMRLTLMAVQAGYAFAFERFKDCPFNLPFEKLGSAEKDFLLTQLRKTARLFKREKSSTQA